MSGESTEPEKTTSERLLAAVEEVSSGGAVDPIKVIPVEAARAHLKHWWREPLAGFLALGTGVYDSWRYGHDAGLSSSLDEILVIGGVVLIAGSRRLFSPPAILQKAEQKEER